MDITHTSIKAYNFMWLIA